MNKPYRGTIFVEDTEILANTAHPGGHYIMRLRAPRTAEHARCGQFVYLRCDPLVPMRRPMSLMRVDAEQSWIELLYKPWGWGTSKLVERRPGDSLSLMGPIGVPFKQSSYRARPILLGGGFGIPSIVFLASHIKRQTNGITPLALVSSEVPFPFTPRPSQFMVPGVPADTIAAMPLMEDWKIPSRLASLKGFPGCYEGVVTELARSCLNALSAEQKLDVELFACGPRPMLKATAELARAFGLPCQLSMEEFMACAVGGCAGCAIKINTETGPAMKRVCVDGPVFEAETVCFD
jgi:dihydroorotate dehydrogenase electron transfer subunit